MSYIVVDTETNSGAIDGNLTDLWVFGMYYPETDEVLTFTADDWDEDRDGFSDWLQGTLNNEENEVIFHNALFDVWVLEEYFGVKLTRWHDTLLLSYNVNPMGGHSLRAWGERLGFPKIDFKDYDKGYSEEMREYLIQDLKLTWKVWLELYEDEPPIYRMVDLPFESIILEMQKFGIKLNMSLFDEVIESVNKELEPVLEELNRIAPLALGKESKTKQLRKQFIPKENISLALNQEGQYVLMSVNEDDPDKRYTWRKIEKYNPNSAEQTAFLLQHLYDWEPERRSAKTGKACVDKEVLSELDYPLAQTLLDYSSLNKLVTTYGESLKSKADKHGRIHTNYNNTVTATGRLSSSNPNLQNIPGRGERGNQIRKLFIAKDGYKLVGADIDQFQMRILAWYLSFYLSDEDEYPSSFALWEDFNFSEKPDPHAVTARLVFGEEFTPDQRKQAKTINFGIIFGIGVAKLARQLGLSIAESQRLLDAVGDKVPEIDILRQIIWYLCRKNQGVVYTLFGRRGYYPNILSEDGNLRSRAERQAFNFMIQGTEADIIKMMMLLIKRFMRQAKLAGYFVMQIHDEFVLEVPYYEANETIEIVNHVINDFTWLPNLKVTGSAHAGDSWADCH